MSRNLGSNVSDIWQYFEKLLGIAVRDSPAFTRTIGKGQDLTHTSFSGKKWEEMKKEKKEERRQKGKGGRERRKRAHSLPLNHHYQKTQRNIWNLYEIK